MFVLLVVAVVGVSSAAHGSWSVHCGRPVEVEGFAWCRISYQQLLITSYSSAEVRPSASFALDLFPEDESQKELFGQVDGGEWMRLDELPTSAVVPQTPVSTVFDAMRRGRVMTIKWFWPREREPSGELHVPLLGFTRLLQGVEATLEANHRQPRSESRERPGDNLPVPPSSGLVQRTT